MSDAVTNLDARGLLCPLPVIRTQDAIRELPQGATLVVTASDPGTEHDIPAWCRVHGHAFTYCETSDREWQFTIVVGDGD